MILMSVRKQIPCSSKDIVLDINLTIGRDEFLCLFGKSGAGKTTIIRMLAGLCVPDEGIIYFDGQPWFDSRKKINLPPEKRNISLLFQEQALFPHMTVAQNIRYGACDEKTAERMLQVMELQGLEKRRPCQLSGGQQQRTALARTLARCPRLLLLDEPFSALDERLKRHLRTEICKMHREFHWATLMITHDLEDRRCLGDRSLELKKGRLREHPILVKHRGGRQVENIAFIGGCATASWRGRS